MTGKSNSRHVGPGREKRAVLGKREFFLLVNSRLEAGKRDAFPIPGRSARIEEMYIRAAKGKPEGVDEF